MPPESELDPDIADHLARERAFDGVFFWPPLENVTKGRPCFILEPWSIDREAALRAIVPESAGDAALDTALCALWLASHSSDDIILFRVQSLAVQFRQLVAWSRANVLVSEREALLKLVDAVLKAADECKTIPAHEGGGGPGNASRR